MEGPILLLVLTTIAVGLWIWAELAGAEWQRFIAGFGMAICFALCGAGVMGFVAFTEQIATTHRLNQVVRDMLDRTVERLEADDREDLLSDLRDVRERVVPTYEYWTFEEPFVEFARSKDRRLLMLKLTGNGRRNASNAGRWKRSFL